MKKLEMTDEKKTLARTGFIHVAFSVGSKEAVDALTARIGQSSITESKFMDEDFLARHRSALVAFHNLELRGSVLIQSSTRCTSSSLKFVISMLFGMKYRTSAFCFSFVPRSQGA